MKGCSRRALVELSKIPEGHAARVCRHILGDGLERLGIDVSFLHTYSVEKRSEFVDFLDQRFIVIDHALSELFGNLNYVFGTEEPENSLTIGLLQRALAEACRAAGLSRRREYAFFVRRALETEALPAPCASWRTSQYRHLLAGYAYYGA